MREQPPSSTRNTEADEDRESQHGVRRARTSVERDSRADDRNGEPDEEGDQQLRGHRDAVLGSRPVQHEAGRPLVDRARPRPDQAAADEKQRKARSREAIDTVDPTPYFVKYGENFWRR